MIRVRAITTAPTRLLPAAEPNGFLNCTEPVAHRGRLFALVDVFITSGSTRRPAASDGGKAGSRIHARTTATPGHDAARRRSECRPACRHLPCDTAARAPVDRAHWRTA